MTHCLGFPGPSPRSCPFCTILVATLCKFCCCSESTHNIVLRSEIPSGMSAKLHTVAASNNRDHAPQSLYYCLFAPHMCWRFSSRTSSSWWITHSTQRQRSGCNNIPFYNEPHRSYVLCRKAELGTTSTSWSQHHFVAIGKARAACVQSFTLWQEATIEIMRRNHSIIACSRHLYIGVFLRAHPVRGESHKTKIWELTQRGVQTLGRWSPISEIFLASGVWGQQQAPLA